MRAADEWIDRIVASAEIPRSARRRDVTRELQCHVEDFVLAARAGGRSDAEIERLLAANFGDTEAIGRQFAWVYRRERAAARTAVAALSICLVAAVTLFAALTLQSILDPSIVRSLASRHTFLEARNILATAAFFFAIRAARPLRRPRTFVFGAVAVVLAVIFPAPFLVGFAAALALHIIGFVASQPARFVLAAASFSAAGVVLWSRLSLTGYPLASAAASWFAMGAAYHFMTVLAPRIQRGLSARLLDL